MTLSEKVRTNREEILRIATKRGASEIRCKVDVVEEEGLRPESRDMILREAVSL